MNYRVIKKIDEKIFKGRLKKAYGVMYVVSENVLYRRRNKNIFRKIFPFNFIVH